LRLVSAGLAVIAERESSSEERNKTIIVAAGFAGVAPTSIVERYEWPLRLIVGRIRLR